MATREPPTYRVRRIPGHLAGFDVGRFLCDVVKGLAIEQLRICSLAPTPDDFNRPPSQAATVQLFGIVPECLSVAGDEWRIHVPGQPHPLLFDTHFYRFTPLNQVDSGAHEFDLIALSGLAGHAFGSWKRQGTESTTFMWLRDQLPRDFPNLRVMVYGYDTKLLKSESFQTIDDLALAFVSQLKSIGKAQTFARPVVILAHSLGGLLVKRALCYLASSGESEAFMLSKIRMVMFFGVPSQGMKMSHLIPMVDGQPNKFLVECLSEADPHVYLAWLNDAFSGISLFRKVRLVSAYETGRTKIVEEVSPGKWARTGEAVELVSKQSAIQRGSRVPEDVFPINRDHSAMVKFTEDDVSYPIVKGYIQDTSNGLEAAYDFSASVIAPTRPPSSHDFPTQSDNSNQKALDSLAFIEMYQRRDQIDVAHFDSFQWLLDEGTGLTNWLLSDDSLFWICGLAGSGKSTAMKHLHALLSNADGAGSLITPRDSRVAWYYFSQRGTYLQKSVEGLMRSIMHQLGSTVRAIGNIIHDFYITKNPKLRDVWTDEDLLQLLRQVTTEVRLDGAVILFLDALDEFNGFPETIADFLTTLAGDTSPGHFKIKICFSSRPWDVFVERFQQKRGFKLQEWTRGDISKYSSYRLATIATASSGITTSVAAKASSSTTPLRGTHSRPQANNTGHAGGSSSVGDSEGRVPARWELTGDNMGRTFYVDHHNRSPTWTRLPDLKDEQQNRTETNPQIESLRHPNHVLPLQTHSDSGQPADPETVLELVKYITDHAQGVFLWARLILDDLEKVADPTPERLRAQLSKLPTELQEYYDLTLKRIAPRDREDAFIILELTLRNEGAVPLSRLFHAYRCARGVTFAACEHMIQSTRAERLSEPEMSTRLKDLCGGLLDIDRSRPRGPSVQFMHQTAREYANAPELQKQLIGTSRIQSLGNGHVFWFKYLLAAWSGRSSFERLIATAHSAEYTLGYDFTQFLDSIPNAVFERAYLHLKTHQVYEGRKLSALCNSSLSFAVMADLKLYMTRKINESQVRGTMAPDAHNILNLNPDVPLLHFICSFVAAEGPYSDQQYRQSQTNFGWEPVSYDLVGMTRLLLTSGVDWSAKWRDKTAFQSLFYYCFEGVHGSRGAPISSLMVGIADELLAAGADPNTYLIGPSRTGVLWKRMKRTRCFEGREHDVEACCPLHVSHGLMTRVLLQRGADVNARDSDGHTPLDIFIGLAGDAFEIGFLRRSEEALETTALLVEHGGCLSKGGHKYLHRRYTGQKRKDVRRFMEAFQNLGRTHAHIIEAIERAGVLPDEPMSARMAAQIQKSRRQAKQEAQKLAQGRQSKMKSFVSAVSRKKRSKD